MNKFTLENQVLKFKNGQITVENLINILNKIPFETLFIAPNGKLELVIHPNDESLQVGQRIERQLFFKSLPSAFDILEKLKHGKNEKIERALKVDDQYFNLTFIAVHNEQNQYQGCLQLCENITSIIEKYRFGGFIESEFQKSTFHQEPPYHFNDDETEKYRQTIEQDLIDLNHDESDGISGASEL